MFQCICCWVPVSRVADCVVIVCKAFREGGPVYCCFLFVRFVLAGATRVANESFVRMIVDCCVVFDLFSVPVVCMGAVCYCCEAVIGVAVLLLLLLLFLLLLFLFAAVPVVAVWWRVTSPRAIWSLNW